MLFLLQREHTGFTNHLQLSCGSKMLIKYIKRDKGWFFYLSRKYLINEVQQHSLILL